MKKWIVALLFGFLASAVFADGEVLHLHPSLMGKNTTNGQPVKSPACIIKIMNDSHDDIIVYGTFDDGAPLTPFVIYAYETPHYIVLDYNGFCHAGMDIGIDTTSGLRLFRDFTWVNSRLRIMSGWFKPYIVLDRS